MTRPGMQLVTVYVLLFLYPSAWAFEGCSVSFGKRGCQHRILHGVLVICDGHGTEGPVPKNLPQDAIYLSLNNFNFSRPLLSSDFSRLTTVQCLTIRNSVVAGVEETAFSEFKSLFELTLINTKLNESEINFLTHPNFKVELLQISESPSLTKLQDVDVKENLQGLKTLNLNQNSLESISRNFFVNLKSLERLDLSNNRLSSLPWETFSHLEKLNHLFLAGNYFQTIPDSMHRVFFAVKALSLSRNPLHCNCRLTWLKDFYRKAVDKELDAEHVYCRDPKHTRIGHFPSAVENFRCSTPQTPVISWTMAPDGRIETNCTAYGDPAPQLTITLHRFKRKFVVPPSDNLGELNTTTPQMLIQPSYMVCEANNSEGSSMNKIHVGPILDADSKSSPLAAWSYCSTYILLAALFVTRL